MTGLMHTCGMIRSYVWHKSFVCGPQEEITERTRPALMHACDMTYWPQKGSTGKDAHLHSIMCLAWLFHICDMTHSHADLRKESQAGHRCSLSLNYIFGMSLSYLWHDTFACGSQEGIAGRAWILVYTHIAGVTSHFFWRYSRVKYIYIRYVHTDMLRACVCVWGARKSMCVSRRTFLTDVCGQYTNTRVIYI